VVFKLFYVFTIFWRLPNYYEKKLKQYAYILQYANTGVNNSDFSNRNKTSKYGLVMGFVIVSIKFSLLIINNIYSSYMAYINFGFRLMLWHGSLHQILWRPYIGAGKHSLNTFGLYQRFLNCAPRYIRGTASSF